MKMIISADEATKAPILRIGNTQTHVKFSSHPDEYMDRWFAEAPAHHCAMSVGNNVSTYIKTAELVGFSKVIV